MHRWRRVLLLSCRPSSIVLSKTMPSMLARPIIKPRAFACAAAGSLLGGSCAAIAVAGDTSLQLLAVSAGPGGGEGQLTVVCEQPLFAAVRALAVVPGGGRPGSGPCQVRLPQPAVARPSIAWFLFH